jgi:putative Holliday junction resolvase
MCSYKRSNQFTEKILCLDPGDEWTGTALSDSLKLIAKPHLTISTKLLESQLHNILNKEQIREIVIGYPLTLRGTQSEQTQKVLALKKKLEDAFPAINFHLWDERLSSKKADSLKRAQTKQEKLEAHSIAAAFILQSYLDYIYQQKKEE